MDKHWKRFERTVAKRLGGVRHPVDGKAENPDVSAGHRVVEVKHWAKVPRQIERALEQAEEIAGSEQLPIAVIGGRGRRWNEALVVMRLGDYVDWYE